MCYEIIGEWETRNGVNFKIQPFQKLTVSKKYL